jgi:hypothetical protein
MIDNEIHRDAAHDFIKALGLEPNSEAISQLSGPFAEALRVQIERDYGSLWKSKGWKGLVQDVLNKAGRLRYRSWLRNGYNPDDPIDIINFAGFLWQTGNEGPKWGELGEPG